MKYSLLVATGLIISFSSCHKASCSDGDAVNYGEEGPCTYAMLPKVKINFSHNVDGGDLVYNDLSFVNASGNHYSIETLEYIISDVVFHGIKGDVKIDAEHYVNPEDVQSIVWNTGVSLPVDSYSSVSFIFGLVESKNVTDYFSDQPFLNMAWPEPMGGGYHYMRLEGKYDSASTGVIKPFLTHFGPSMGSHFYVEVDLTNSAFEVSNVGGSQVILNLSHNVNKWYTEPNAFNFETLSGPIMGNQAAQTLLMENGNNVFSVSPIIVE